jgi:hypothetical protein
MVAVQGIRGVSRGFEGTRRGDEEDVQQGAGRLRESRKKAEAE